jgi:hypothetical protein
LLDFIHFGSQSIPWAEEFIPLILHCNLLLSHRVFSYLNFLLLLMQYLFQLIKLCLPVSEQSVFLWLKPRYIEYFKVVQYFVFEAKSKQNSIWELV